MTTIGIRVIGDNDVKELCLRNCFKLQRRTYVDFCLEKKCGGIEFRKAAGVLGYTK